MRALLVVDVQNDFLPGGALAVSRGDAVLDTVNRLMASFHAAGDIVVCTADWHPENHVSFATNHPEHKLGEAIDLPYGKQVLWPVHCVAGTCGAEFSPALHSDLATAIIRKGMHSECDSYSAFLEADRKTTTGLASFLKERGVDSVWVTGLATDFCVSWTALDAASFGFRSTVVMDACAAIDFNGSLGAARVAWKNSGVTECFAREIL